MDRRCSHRARRPRRGRVRVGCGDFGGRSVAESAGAERVGSATFGCDRVCDDRGMKMETVTEHSIERATDEAVRLWSLASAQYPIQGGAAIQARLEYMVIESASAFSFNARRATEALSRDKEYKLHQPRYEWRPTVDGEVVVSFWDALNRIIHSQKMKVGFEQLPSEVSVMSEGAYVVPYIRAETDRRKLAFVDIFALSYCFLYEVLPVLLASTRRVETVH